MQFGETRLTEDSRRTRARSQADAQFKRPRQADKDGAMAEYKAAATALSEKTARLREARLQKEAAEKRAAPVKKPARKKPAARTKAAKDPT